MKYLFPGLFAAVAICMVAASDFYTQALRAEKAGRAFSLASYAGSYTRRYNDMMSMRALKARQGTPAKTHLPEAPEGWTRAEYVPDVPDQLDYVTAEAAVRTLIDRYNTDAMSREMIDKRLRAARRQAKARMWEYRRGSEVIRLSAHFEKPDDTPPGVQGAALATGALDPERMHGAQGYAMVHNVPFYRVANPLTQGRGADAEAFQVIEAEAELGGAITLVVQAFARDASVRDLIGRIDYAALNAMLDEPLAGVGADAPHLSVPEQIAAAEAAQLQRLAMARANAIALQQDLQNEAATLAALTPSSAVLPEGDMAGLVRQVQGGRAAPDASPGLAASMVAGLAQAARALNTRTADALEPAPAPAIKAKVRTAGGDGATLRSQGCGAGSFCKVGD